MRTGEVETARESLSILAAIADFHDDDSSQHAQRVGITAARIAQALGADIRGFGPSEAALAGIEELYRLTEDVGIPTMRDLGFSEEEIPMLARIAYEDPQTVGNPREVTVVDYEGLYRNAFARGN